MVVRNADLTTRARIRNAALEGFARDGVAATSIRDVAAAAGVSPGLVQHHFATKGGLRDAVNEYVIAIAREAFSDVPGAGSPTAYRELGRRITETIREHPTAFIYVARSLAEGDEAAAGVFDAFVDIAETQLGRLRDEGLLNPDIDLEWAALEGVIYCLGTLLFEHAVSRRLGQPFFTDAALERWDEASNELHWRGLNRR